MQKPVKIISWSKLPDRKPIHVVIKNVDLVIIRYDDNVSVLYGRCLHRGALLSDEHIEGDNLICGLHGWDYRYDTGISEYNNQERLKKFTARVDQEHDAVYVDQAEVQQWEKENPQPYNQHAYLGLYADIHGTEEEPHNHYIQQLAKQGIKGVGKHGVSSAMGVPLNELPAWNDIQIITAQLARKPLQDDEEVASELIIGPKAKKPLKLKIPIFVSDMSFGALSEEAKIALAKGVE